ncbi:hypothetical protein [Klebsiella oxytoca]|uniref:hypothetical protein n=1 Tax=Klebsiella oxytoca TaxID=571 RepID=UPI0038B803B1
MMEIKKATSAVTSGGGIADIKKPRRGEVSGELFIAFRRCHRGAALPSMKGLLTFLAHFQLHME